MAFYAARMIEPCPRSRLDGPIGYTTQSRTLSALLALPESGHSFIGSRLPCSSAGMAKIGTNLPIADYVGNDRFRRNQPFMVGINALCYAKPDRLKTEGSWALPNRILASGSVTTARL
jgi:hypothetical protein